MARVRVVDGRNVDPLQALRVGGLVFAVLFVLFVINSAYFQVESEEEGVVTRFGAYHRIAGPGLHFKWPFAESVDKVPTLRVLKMEFGFNTSDTGLRASLTRSEITRESRMITGDLGAAEVEWIVQYRILDTQDYLFKVADPENTLRDLSEAAMRASVGDRSVFEVLTVGRDAIKTAVQTRLQADLDRYQAGIRIERVQLQTVGPPDERVTTAFNGVNQAEQEKERTINEAKAEYNEKIPKASGEAQREIAFAEGYRIERVNRAKGEASRFTALLKEYQLAPEVTRRRMYLEAMEVILPAIGSKVIVDEDIESALPLLHLGSKEGR